MPIVYAKFEQNQEIANLLIDTGEKELGEVIYTWTTSIFG